MANKIATCEERCQKVVMVPVQFNSSIMPETRIDYGFNESILFFNRDFLLIYYRCRSQVISQNTRIWPSAYRYISSVSLALYPSKYYLYDENIKPLNNCLFLHREIVIILDHLQLSPMLSWMDF